MKVTVLQRKTKRNAIGIAIAASLVVGGVAPFLIKDEGVAQKPYYDIAGVLTDCIGRTGPEVKLGVNHSKAECTGYLMVDIERNYYGPLVQKVMGFNTLPLPTQIAITRFAYNVGVGAATGGSVGKALNRGDIKAACDAMMLYNKARVNGKLTAVRGLTLRRERERAQCLEGAANG